MPQSRLFVSSVSRTRMGRRRTPRRRLPPALPFLLLLVIVAALAFAAGHGGL